MRAQREASEAGLPPKRHLLRGDIEGLRAVAVLLVVANHVFSWPSGGFVGVDVFFVISGFLITGMLDKEQQTTENISLSNFYRRRIRRIIPAATLVLVATAVASHVVFRSDRAHDTFVDGLWSFVFASNWHFAAIGTDYFQANRALSPLQHFWSLSVEEQFYFVWPVLLLGTLTIGAGRQTKGSRLPMYFALGVVVVGSFVLCVMQTNSDRTSAYFSTFSRTWELGLGAILAVSTPALATLRARLRTVLMWTGLGVVVWSAFAINDESSFPGPAALLPVMGAVLIVAAGTGASTPVFMPILDNPLSKYIGRISYSLYLWHWPVVVLAGAVIARGTFRFAGVVLVLSLTLAMVSFHLFEDPVRKSRWLAPKASTRGGLGAPAAWLKVQNLSLVALGLLVVIGTGVVLQRSPQPGVLPVSAARIAVNSQLQTASVGATPSPVPAPSPIPTVAAPLSAAITNADLQNALHSDTWPDIKIDNSATRLYGAVELGGSCFNNRTENDKTCTYGQGAHRAVLFGDSIALSYGPMLQDALPAWTLTTFGKYGCPWEDALIQSTGQSMYSNCIDFHKIVLQKMAALHPEVIFVSSAEYAIGSLGAGIDRESAWSAAAARMVDDLTALHARVVFLTPPPAINSMTGCATGFNKPSDCNGTIGKSWRQMSSAVRAVVTPARPLFSFIDTSSWFCTSDDKCPIVFEKMPIRYDDKHIFSSYAERLAANFLTAFEDLPKV